MEQMIAGWISSNLATVITWVVGLPAVFVVIKKYGPVFRKWVKIVSEGMDVIDMCIKVLEDSNVTDEEIATVLKEAKEFKEACK